MDSEFSNWHDKRYADDSGKGYLRVIGYIDKPALILKNPITGERETVIIGCLNHQEMREVSEGEALTISENHNFNNCRGV